MSAKLIDGKAIALQLRTKIHSEIDQIQAKHSDFKPSLVIIQVGERPDSSTYVKMKLKAAEEAAISCELIQLSESITEFELLNEIVRLNEDISVDGILVQLPLPAHLNETKITSTVVAEKDVDGFGPYNVGELAKKGGNPYFLPCTPKGIIELLSQLQVPIAGSNAVVLGRSDIVGKPIANLLTQANATVTTLHSKTPQQQLELFLSQADIVIAAIGQPQFIKGEWLKQGVVVIDVGTNFIPDATKKSGSRMVGDCDFESCSHKASLITPVPGGVGPMTVATLLDNVVIAAKRNYEKNNVTPKFTNPLKLNLLKPVPSDFEISRNQNLRRLAKLLRKQVSLIVN